MAGKLTHTVTAVDGAFASGNLDAGKSYSFTFSESGTYAYYCEYYGGKCGQDMFGKVIVIAGAAAPEAQVAGPAAPPKIGGAGPRPLAAILVALFAAGGGVALRSRTRRSPEAQDS